MSKPKKTTKRVSKPAKKVAKTVKAVKKTVKKAVKRAVTDWQVSLLAAVPKHTPKRKVKAIKTVHPTPKKAVKKLIATKPSPRMKEKLEVIEDITHSAHNGKPLDETVVKSLRRIPIATLHSLREGFLACYDEGSDFAFRLMEPKDQPLNIHI